MPTQIIRIHIEYNNRMTVATLEKSLNILNSAFAQFSEMEHINLSDSNNCSPEIKSISNGSLILDVIVPVSCALLPILYDIIKSHFRTKTEYVVIVDRKRDLTLWTTNDNYEICRKVLEEYANKNSGKSIETLIDELQLSKEYKKNSIRAKIQNTKWLLENRNINNSLTIAPLKNCSKAHIEQFKKACVDLGV